MQEIKHEYNAHGTRYERGDSKRTIYFKLLYWEIGTISFLIKTNFPRFSLKMENHLEWL